MKRYLGLATVLTAVCLSTTPAAAHSKKESTVPADGAVLDAPPDAIVMRFDKPMRITMFRLIDTSGAEFDADHTDGMAPVTEFEAKPAVLSPGGYTVDWRGLAADGHPMAGSFSFEIAD